MQIEYAPWHKNGSVRRASAPLTVNSTCVDPEIPPIGQSESSKLEQLRQVLKATPELTGALVNGRYYVERAIEHGEGAYGKGWVAYDTVVSQLYDAQNLVLLKDTGLKNVLQKWHDTLASKTPQGMGDAAPGLAAASLGSPSSSPRSAAASRSERRMIDRGTRAALSHFSADLRAWRDQPCGAGKSVSRPTVNDILSGAAEPIMPPALRRQARGKVFVLVVDALLTTGYLLDREEVFWGFEPAHLVDELGRLLLHIRNRRMEYESINHNVGCNRVFLKTFHPVSSKDPDPVGAETKLKLVVANVHKELLLARKAIDKRLFRHKNIVRYLDVCRAGTAVVRGQQAPTPPFPFIVTEFVEGRVLHEYVEKWFMTCWIRTHIKSKQRWPKGNAHENTRGGPVPLDDLRVARCFFRQLMQAVEKMHSEDCYSFDIKPENIMIRQRDKCLKLMDFGFGKARERFRRAKERTPAAPAPGTLRGARLGLGGSMAAPLTPHTRKTQRLELWMSRDMPSPQPRYMPPDLRYRHQGNGVKVGDKVLPGPVDIWLCGTTLMKLTCMMQLTPLLRPRERDGKGTLPEVDDNFDQFLAKYDSIPARFDERLYRDGPALYDLLSKMLDSNQRRRPTALEVLQHPWVLGDPLPSETARLEPDVMPEYFNDADNSEWSLPPGAMQKVRKHKFEDGFRYKSEEKYPASGLANMISSWRIDEASLPFPQVAREATKMADDAAQ